MHSKVRIYNLSYFVSITQYTFINITYRHTFVFVSTMHNLLNLNTSGVRTAATVSASVLQ